jgi:hypothetical protein
MSAYASRPYIGTADLPGVLALLRTCRALEDGDPWPSLHDIRRQLAMVTSGAASQVHLWEDGTGQLLAFAMLWDAEVLVFCVRPSAPRADLLTAIFAWGRRRTQQWGERAPLCVLLRADDRSCSAVLERQGFLPEPWSTLQMQRTLTTSIPAPQLPNGYTLRSLADETEIAAVAALPHPHPK